MAIFFHGALRARGCVNILERVGGGQEIEHIDPFTSSQS